MACFAVVAQERTLARAAQRPHLRQPAVSKTLAGLEALAGRRLVERGRAGVQLTPASEQFLPAVAALPTVAGGTGHAGDRPGGGGAHGGGRCRSRQRSPGCCGGAACRDLGAHGIRAAAATGRPDPLPARALPLLSGTVWITPQHAVQFDIDSGSLCGLGGPVPGGAEPVGLPRRGEAIPNQLAEQLMDILRELS